jgi:integrase
MSRRKQNRRRRPRVDFRKPIRVWVIFKKGKRNLALRWNDPRTRKTVEKSSGTSDRREAERIAALLEQDLQDGFRFNKLSWDDFCLRYEKEKLVTLSEKSQGAWVTASNWLEKLMPPRYVQDIDASYISLFTAKLREHVANEVSVASYLRVIRAALNWAERMEIIWSAPYIEMPKRAKGRSSRARSRPIVLEELERILEATKKVRPKDYPQWQRYIRGLYESGLRIGEFHNLSWTPGAPMWMDTTFELPFIQILAEGEKAHQDRFQPVTPQFWELCCETPEEDRRGPVFPLRKPGGGLFGCSRACHVIINIGRSSNVVTDPATGKTATSHDIGRRALTSRLGAILSQAELATWMRHESVDTTMGYYYRAEAMALARKVWGTRSAASQSGDASPVLAGNSE